MSESYKSGSVRGVRSNAHPYRDKSSSIWAACHTSAGTGIPQNS